MGTVMYVDSVGASRGEFIINSNVIKFHSNNDILYYISSFKINNHINNEQRHGVENT